MHIKLFLRLILVSICFLSANQINAQTEGFDVVFKQPRAIGHETNLDAIRYVGVRGNKISAVSEGPIIRAVEIDAKGKVLGPGFFGFTHTCSKCPIILDAGF